MGAETKIEWTDHSASPWHGCEHAILPDGSEHPGCGHCYAEAMARRNPGTLGEWGPQGTRVLSKTFHDNCRRWNTAAEKAGKRQSVFPSICDPFEDWQGPMLDNHGRQVCWVGGRPQPEAPDSAPHFRPYTMADALRELFVTIDACPWLDFMLLTKRPGNVQRFWPEYSFHACTTGDCPHDTMAECDADNSRWCRDNVFLIYSASDQASLDAGVVDLLACRDFVPVLGVSAEPLIGPVEFSNVTNRTDAVQQLGKKALSGIDWVIVGGESGHGARPCDLAWIRSIVGQCKAAGVPCFVKQLGSNPWMPPEELAERRSQPNYRPLRDSKGGNIEEWPADIRVRQFPEAVAQ